MSAKRILLVTDRPGLAFAAVADFVAQAVAPHYSCDVLCAQECGSQHALLERILAGDHDLVHFFWRRALSGLLAECASDERLWRRFLARKMTISIPDHLYADTKNQFIDLPVFMVATSYVCVSRMLEQTYRRRSLIEPPWGYIYDVNDVVAQLLAAPPVDQTDDAMAVGWVGNSDWGSWFGYDDYKGLRTIVEPAFARLDEGLRRQLTLRVADSHRHRLDRSGIFDLLSSTHIYCCASITEGMPVPAVESMAAGGAIVTTSCGIYPEIAPPEALRFVVPRDVGVFSDAIAALARDRELRLRLGCANRALAKELVDTARQKWPAFFTDALARTTPRPLDAARRYIIERRPGQLQRLLRNIRGTGRRAAAALRTVPGIGGLAGQAPQTPRLLTHNLRPTPRHAVDAAIRAIIDGSALPARVQGNALAIYAPRWLGNAHSTTSLFDHCLPVPPAEDLKPAMARKTEVEAYAMALQKMRPRKIVVSGGDLLHLRIIERLHEIAPAIRCELLWHGSPALWIDTYERDMILRWLDAAKSGRIAKIWFLKSGQDDHFRHAGIDAEVIVNLLPEQPMPDCDGRRVAAVRARVPSIGVWASGADWRKNPINQLIAAVLVDGAKVVHNLPETLAAEIVARFGHEHVHAELPLLDRTFFLQNLRRCDVNCYVTFAESSPMVPLESIAVGRPCLVAPTTTYFDLVPELADYLVVPDPDSTVAIRKAILRVLDNYPTVISLMETFETTHRARGAEIRRRLAE